MNQKAKNNVCLRAYGTEILLIKLIHSFSRNVMMEEGKQTFGKSMWKSQKITQAQRTWS